MPLTANLASFRRLGRQFRDLATRGSEAQEAVLEAMKPEIRGVLAKQFSEGIDPDGLTWDRTVRKKQALNSRKLPQAFAIRIIGGTLSVRDRAPRRYMTAHQFGHTFPPRNVARGGSARTVKKWRKNGDDWEAYETVVRPGVMFFGKRGQLLKHRAGLARDDGKNLRFGHATFARAHRIGERILPARPLLPQGTSLPPMWRDALARGAQSAVLKWAGRAGLVAR